MTGPEGVSGDRRLTFRANSSTTFPFVVGCTHLDILGLTNKSEGLGFGFVKEGTLTGTPPTAGLRHVPVADRKETPLSTHLGLTDPGPLPDRVTDSDHVEGRRTAHRPRLSREELGERVTETGHRETRKGAPEDVGRRHEKRREIYHPEPRRACNPGTDEEEGPAYKLLYPSPTGLL